MPHGAVVVTSRSKAAYLAPLKDELDRLQKRYAQKASEGKGGQLTGGGAFPFRLHFEKVAGPLP